MNSIIRQSLWKQFGASIDMLENAIALCDDDLWDNDRKFWYIAYHCLFYLDYYLTLNPSNYSPPSPFSTSELNPSGTMPERVYNKDELLQYLRYSRNKCYDLVNNLTDEIANSRWINESKNFSVFEILIYNMRHVQHHAAQLNLILRESKGNAPKWVSQTNIDL